MFETWFKKVPDVTPDPGPITVRPTFPGCEDAQTGVSTGWQATGAPEGVVCNVEFPGRPLDITTVGVWDGKYRVLRSVYATRSDASFVLKAGWAYGDPAADESGRVGPGWAFGDAADPERVFGQGGSASVSFDCDPHQKKLSKDQLAGMEQRRSCERGGV